MRSVLSDAALTSLTEQLAEQSGETFRCARIEISVDPLGFVQSSSDVWAGYFGLPGTNEIGGIGVAWRSTSAPDEDRFGRLGSQLRALGLPSWARVLVGFSFSADGGSRPEWDGFTPTSAVLPMAAVIRAGDRHELVVAVAPGQSPESVIRLLSGLSKNVRVEAARASDHSIESRPAPAEYERAVAEAVDAILGGQLDKVVLARSVVVTSDEGPHPFELAERLRADYPACYTFGWREGDATFVGASPELLVATEDRAVRSHPLAGSAPRGEGDDLDRAIGEALMASSKDRSEHELVVHDIARRLRSVTTNLAVAEHPSLRKLTHVQHLSSEIAGTLNEDLSVVEVAGLIHPTPAVGGSPGSEAAALIAKSEDMDRGWYAGGLGWSDGTGSGEIAVALRCALLRGQQAFVYAGAGIVADSDPHAELEETRLKFRTIMHMLAES